MDLVSRRKRIRARLKYITNRPRLSVHKSNRYLYAQLIDQSSGKILAAYSTKKLLKEKPKLAEKKPVEQALEVGRILGKIILKQKIKEIVFDRSGYKYHGKIKALAEGLREAGLNF